MDESASKSAPPRDESGKDAGRENTRRRPGARRLGLATLLAGLLAGWGLGFDDSIRPDPYDPDPSLLDWFLYRQPDGDLGRIPVLPVGWSGTLTFRPAETAWLSEPLPDLSRVAGWQGTRPENGYAIGAFGSFAQCTQDGLTCWLAMPEPGGEPATPGALLLSRDGGSTWSWHSQLPAGAGPGAPRDYTALLSMDENGAQGWLVTHQAQVYRAVLGPDGQAVWRISGTVRDRIVRAENKTPLYFTMPLLDLPSIPSNDRTTVDVGVAVDPIEGFEYQRSDDSGEWHIVSSVGAIAVRSSFDSPPDSFVYARPQFLTSWSYNVVRDSMRMTFVAGGEGALLRISESYATAESGRDLRLLSLEQIETPVRIALRSLYIDPNNGLGWAASGWLDREDFGGRPVILQTLDEGKTWSELSYARLPAPWAMFLALPTFLFLCTYGGVDWLRRRPIKDEARLEGIGDSGRTDRPLSWNDHDVLNVKPRAKAISRLIRNADTAPPLTLAIVGQWGSGKSSLMNLIAEDLRRFGTRPVSFNAWHHQNEESLLAALLEAIRGQAFPGALSPEGLRFRLRLVWLRARSNLRYFLLLLATLALVTVLAYVFIHLPWRVLAQALGDALNPTAHPAGESLPQADNAFTRFLHWLLGDSDNDKRELSFWEGLGTLAGLSGATATLPVLLKRLRVISAEPARLLQGLSARTSVGGFTEMLSFRHRFAEQFAQVCRELRQGQGAGIVVMIDDLDRCRSENVMTILEAVNFLVSAGECFIVLGIDYDRVRRSVADSYLSSTAADVDASAPEPAGARALTYADRYLEKLINIVVSIPGTTDVATADLLTGVHSDATEAPAKRPQRLAHLLERSLRVLVDSSIVLVVLGLFLGLAVFLAEWIPAILPRSPEPLTEAANSTAPPTAQPLATDGTVIDPGALVLPSISPRFDLTAKTLGTSAAWLGWLVVAMPMAALLLVMLRRVLQPQEQHIADSAGFRESLRACAPAVHKFFQTPRAIKRFQNKLRLLAMLDRRLQESPSWVERKLTRPAPAEEGPALPDTDIVILSTIATALRAQGLTGQPLVQATQKLLDQRNGDPADVVAACVRDAYKNKSRPSQAAVMRFFETASQVEWKA